MTHGQQCLLCTVNLDCREWDIFFYFLQWDCLEFGRKCCAEGKWERMFGKSEVGIENSDFLPEEFPGWTISCSLPLLHAYWWASVCVSKSKSKNHWDWTAASLLLKDNKVWGAESGHSAGSIQTDHGLLCPCRSCSICVMTEGPSVVCLRSLSREERVEKWKERERKSIKSRNREALVSWAMNSQCENWRNVNVTDLVKALICSHSTHLYLKRNYRSTFLSLRSPCC